MEIHFRPFPAVPNRKKKKSAIDFLKSLMDRRSKVKKSTNTENTNIVKYKNWIDSFPTTTTPRPPTPTTTTTSPRTSTGAGRSPTRKVSLVSSQPGQRGGGGGGGVYVYLDPQRCFPRHLCRVPHDQFNQMITLGNEIEIL